MIKKALCLTTLILAAGCAIECLNPVKNTPWGGMDYIFEAPAKEENKDGKFPLTDYNDRCSVTNNSNYNLTLRNN
jgi:hypothetical protein